MVLGGKGGPYHWSQEEGGGLMGGPRGKGGSYKWFQGDVGGVLGVVQGVSYELV